MGLIILIVIGIIIYQYIKVRRFYKSNYSKESGVTYRQAMSDKGYYREYLTFKYLEAIDGYYKILTNIYIPKSKDDETTEIDIIFIHNTGIYVIESKNYGGWIFGNEKSRYWMQMFKTGKKEKFYNPIFQNNTHIKYLKELLNDINLEYFKSIIVFSERCEIKKMEIFSDNVQVIKRENLNQTISMLIRNSQTVFSNDEVDNIYNNLKIHGNVSESIKVKHIENIKRKEGEFHKL